MTNDYTHLIEHFREFAHASKKLCQVLSFSEPLRDRKFFAAIIFALGNLPDEVYEDDELMGILDSLVDDGFPKDSAFAEQWGDFLGTLGYAHLRRYFKLGDPQCIERALVLSDLAITLVSREKSPRLWASVQVLAGHAKRLIWSFSDDANLDTLEHYHNALEMIQRDNEPGTWAAIATHLARAYSETKTGDRYNNLRTAVALFDDIQSLWEVVGNKRGVAEARTGLADLLVVQNYDGQALQQAMASYKKALNLLESMGDKSAADEIAEKIKVLENVNFTSYYPRTGVPGKKYGIVVYAHLPELQNNVNLDSQKFSEELGDGIQTPRHSRSSVKLEHNTVITVIPECSEIRFDPPELSKRWGSSWTRFIFDFELAQELIGEVLVVRISIQIAGIEIACIRNCAIEVIESEQSSENENPLAYAKLGSQTSILYQRIFVSYSRSDREVTERYKLAQTALGNEVFIDVDDLRAGENWKAGLSKAIDIADVFQLFWSTNSANSKYCRYEWTYALEFRCPDNECEGFIRPVYWETPMPDPPSELNHVNFKYVPFANISGMLENRDEGEGT